MNNLYVATQVQSLVNRESRLLCLLKSPINIPAKYCLDARHWTPANPSQFVINSVERRRRGYSFTAAAAGVAYNQGGKGVEGGTRTLGVSSNLDLADYTTESFQSYETCHYICFTWCATPSRGWLSTLLYIVYSDMYWDWRLKWDVRWGLGTGEWRTIHMELQ